MSEPSNLDQGLGYGCLAILLAIALVVLFCGHNLVHSLAALLDRLAQ